MAIWQWRQQVQFFTPHFNVYVPDLIFFGGSTSRSNERSERFQAASVGKLLNKLEVKKFHVVGTSYGGFVAYHLANLLGEERVEKVVIASSGVNMRKSDNVALLQRAQLDKIEDLMLPATPQQLRKLMTLSVFKRLHMLPDFFLKDFINKLYAENRKEKMELLKGISLGRDDTLNISPLQQEVLIIWGEHDRIFPVRMTNELKDCLPVRCAVRHACVGSAVVQDASNDSFLSQFMLEGQVVKVEGNVSSFWCKEFVVHQVHSAPWACLLMYAQ
ncbi:Alpha/Beta hydrolase fold [Sesbania bispinosa]|nr:Alpha/Beta hydrolase fold [Sesbania bispinosa]